MHIMVKDKYFVKLFPLKIWIAAEEKGYTAEYQLCVLSINMFLKWFLEQSITTKKRWASGRIG